MAALFPSMPKISSPVVPGEVVHAIGNLIGWLWLVALGRSQSLMVSRGLEDSIPITQSRHEKPV